MAPYSAINVIHFLKPAGFVGHRMEEHAKHSWMTTTPADWSQWHLLIFFLLPPLSFKMNLVVYLSIFAFYFTYLSLARSAVFQLANSGGWIWVPWEPKNAEQIVRWGHQRIVFAIWSVNATKRCHIFTELHFLTEADWFDNFVSNCHLHRNST